MSEEPSAHLPLGAALSPDRRGGGVPATSKGMTPQRPIQEEKRDRALVARMLAGDDRAFEEFFDRYFQGLYRFALTRVDYDEGAAEEIVQAALVRAVMKLYTFRGEAALFTWLCTFCRHEISAYFQKSDRVRKRVELTEDLPEVRAALESLATSSDADPERALLRRETARRVQLVLDFLPPRYGDALEWKYVHGLSVLEIADRLGVGQKAAESLLTRAREAFRDGFTALTTS